VWLRFSRAAASNGNGPSRGWRYWEAGVAHTVSRILRMRPASGAAGAAARANRASRLRCYAMARRGSRQVQHTPVVLSITSTVHRMAESSRWGFAPSFSAQVRFGEPGAPVPTRAYPSLPVPLLMTATFNPTYGKGGGALWNPISREKRARCPNFLLEAPTIAACGAFFTESPMEFAGSNQPHRKIRGCGPPVSGFWVKICGLKILGLALGWSHESRKAEPLPAGLE